MVAGNAEIEESDPVSVNSISQARVIFNSIDPAAQQEVMIVASVSQMIDVTRLNVTVGTRHQTTSKMKLAKK